METEIKEKKKKFVPDLRFQEFQDNWKEVRLGKICSTFKSGSNITSKDIFEEGLYPVYGGNGLRGFTNIFSHEGFYFLIGRQGALCGNINKVNGKIFISEHAIAVQTNSENDTEWLAQKLEYYNLNRLSESSAQPGLAVSKLERLKLKIPSLPEQHKIASFLSAVDKNIQQLTRKKELLEIYKKGVMQQLFSKQVRFKDEDGKDFPEWTWVGGNKLFDNISDKNHNSDLPILAITQDQGAIPRDLINYKITVTKQSVESYKVVQKGDFVISLRTFQGGIEYSDYHGICSPAYIVLRANSKNVDKTFYKLYLKTSFYIKQLQKNLEGIRDGKMISYKYFSEIKIPFPSIEEQKKIADFLSAIDKKIEAISQQIEKTQSFKKGLLQQMFV